MRIERPSRTWISILILGAGYLSPIITYKLDGLLRYRVGFWLQPKISIGGVIALLEVQARDRPASLIPLVGVPIAALLFVIVAWMRRRARARPDGPKGIGGWLGFFVLTSTLGIISNLRVLYISRHAIAANLSELPHLGSIDTPALVALIVARYLVIALVTAACLLGIWHIARRSPRAPAYWTILTAALAPVMVCERAMGAWERTLAARVQITLFPLTPFALSAITAAMVNLLWCVYWLRSRRVRATFGSRGLDLFIDQKSMTELRADSMLEAPRS